MNWELRWRAKRALSLALQRTLYASIPWSIRRARFLRVEIDWDGIGLRRGDRSGLITYSRAGKARDIRYLLSPEDLLWFKLEDPYKNHFAILAEADLILAHRIRVHGCGRVDFGRTIDWAWDPVTGTRFPSGLFSVLPDPRVDGRARTELNLHRHLPVLATAWWLTSRAHYAAELFAELDHWVKTHPPLDDTFLNDGLENSARLLCWTHCLHLAAGAPVDGDLYLRILWAIHAACVRIEQNYDAARLPNNHQIAEAFALFFAGLLYPELKTSRAWLKKGLDLLQKNIEIQFLPGGIHAEQSTNYHLFVLEIYLVTLLLCDRNNIHIPASFRGSVEKAVEYVLHLARPDLTLPNIGDTGMKFFCPTGDPRYHATTFLALGSAIFDRPDMNSVEGGWPEEAFWIAGRPGKQAGDGPAKHSSPPGRRLWNEAGHIVVRSGWSLRALYFHFDFGPQGHGPLAGHSHDDALSFEFHALGETFVVDPGTYTYVRSHPLREYFCGARGHNALLVDGQGPALLSPGPFGWRRRVDAKLREFAECPGLTWFSACYDAFAGSGGPVEVERSVLIVGEEYVLLVDRVRGQGRRRIESLLHFNPEIRLRLDGDILQWTGARANLSVHLVSSSPAERSIHCGEDRIQPGWYSPDYGTVVEAPVFRTCAESGLPFWQSAVLFPTGPKAIPHVVLKRSEGLTWSEGSGPPPAVVELAHSGGITDTLVVREAPGSVSIGGIVTDARMLFLRKATPGHQAWVLEASHWQADDGLVPHAMSRIPS